MVWSPLLKPLLLPSLLLFYRLLLPLLLLVLLLLLMLLNDGVKKMRYRAGLGWHCVLLRNSSHL